MKKLGVFIVGIFKENLVFVLMLGFCFIFGVISSVINGFLMGFVVIVVFVCLNGLIFFFKKFILDEVRIFVFIMIIVIFVIVVDMVMNVYIFDLYKVLGLFIFLIVVNCIVFGRVESFVFKNGVIDFIFDGIGFGIGFILFLIFLGLVREILGNGLVFGILLVFVNFIFVLIFILVFGGFIIIGIIMVCINMKKERDVKKKKVIKK